MNSGENREIARRDRLIACLIAVGGLGSKQIAAITGMSESSVRFSQLRVERLGILPMILKRAGLSNARVNPLAKVQIKTQGENAQEKPGVNAGAKAVAKSQGIAGAKTPSKSQGEDPYDPPLVKSKHKRPSGKKRVGVSRKR